MPTLSIAMQKGGSCKTTTALNLAAAMQLHGKKVLLVDLDPQANLTQSLGVTDDIENSIYELLKQITTDNNLSVADYIIDTAVAPLLPANQKLTGAERELFGFEENDQLLQKVLLQVKDDYDFILIDCPPAFGILTLNSLMASDLVLIPLQAEFLPFKGMQSFMRNFDQIKSEPHLGLELLGIVLTRYDEHKNMHREIKLQLQELYNGKVMNTTIRNNIALAKSQELGVDIFQFDKNCNGAKDYLHLAEEVLERLKF